MGPSGLGPQRSAYLGVGWAGTGLFRAPQGFPRAEDNCLEIKTVAFLFYK